LVEGEDGKITVTPKGDSEPWTITVMEGGAKLRISKEGFEVKSKEVTLNDKGKTLTARLEPVGTPPPVPPQQTEPKPGPVPADGPPILPGGIAPMEELPKSDSKPVVKKPGMVELEQVRTDLRNLNYRRHPERDDQRRRALQELKAATDAIDAGK